MIVRYRILAIFDGVRSMSIRSGEKAYEDLAPIMSKYGARGSPEEFFAAVNQAFHSQEAQVYDSIHSDMWTVLPQQFELLASEACTHLDLTRPLSLVDIGCGTGLAFELFRRTAIGNSVRQVMLVDTASAMLSEARKRSSGWGEVRAAFCLGTVADIPKPASFDVALACSVLHHIPDLPRFFAELRDLLKPGALFFHLQDQNDDADQDVLSERAERLPRSTRTRVRDALDSSGLLDLARRGRRAFKSASSFMGVGGHENGDYVDGTNRILLREGVIRRPMTTRDIWQVTDIHVGDGVGLSLGEMKRHLVDFELVGARSYGFFGEIAALPEHLRSEEARLVAAGDMNGSLLGAVWRKVA